MMKGDGKGKRFRLILSVVEETDGLFELQGENEIFEEIKRRSE